MNIQNLTLVLNNNRLDSQSVIELSKFIEKFPEIDRLDL